MRARGFGLLTGLLVSAALAGPAVAQDLSQGITAPVAPILTLNQERLFAGSRFGQTVQARFEAETQTLAAENREIEAALEAEERELTARRPGLPAADFRALAEAFNVKVEEIRTAQDAKSRSLARSRDEGKQLFYQAALPILGDLMRDMGAVAILNSNAIVLSFDSIDMTDAAIAALDAKLGDGSALETPAPLPAPEPTPAP